MFLTAALAALAAGASWAQELAMVRRGELKVKATGTVVAVDVFRLKSTVDGRVESVTASTNSWATESETLGILANKELAAVIDAHGRTGNDILEGDWQRIYKPTKILCPSDCFILRRFAQAGQPVKAQAVLIEAAKGLRVQGRVKLEDAPLVAYGQALDFWPVGDPARKLKGRVANYRIDAKPASGAAGGSFFFDMTPSAYFDPGTSWEGLILSNVKKDALLVPTAALILHKDALYLPVLVSTGVSTDEETAVIAGVEEGRPILVLDAAKLGSATRHKFSLDEAALQKRLLEDQKRTAPVKARAAKPAQPRAEREPGSGPDPYEE